MPCNPKTPSNRSLATRREEGFAKQEFGNEKNEKKGGYRMSRRLRSWAVWLVVLLALGAGASVCVLYYEPFRLEVPYDGKTQREWAAQLYSSNPEERRAAAKALSFYFFKFGVSRW